MYKIMAGSLTIYDSSDKNTYPVSKPSFEEGLNEAGTLTFTIFPSHPNYNSITRMRTFVTAYRDTREIFYGRVLITDKGLDGRMEVTCEGGLTFFLDTEMGKGQWDETITAFLQRVINNHNSQVEADKRFTLGTVNVPKYNQVQQWDITSYTVTKNVLETMVAGRFGGFFRIRPNPNGYHYLDYLENFGRTNTQRIRIGENIIDKDDHVSGENLFTVLRPIGRAEPTGSGSQDLDVTISSLSQSDVTLPNVTKDGEFLRLTDKIQLYGSIVRTEQFNNATTAIQVLQKAEEFITRRGTLLPANCKINYVDLNHLNKQLGEVLLGDMFNDIEGYSGITMTVSNVNWDMEDPANDTITFQNQEELNANRMDTNVRNSTGGTGGSSSSSLSSSMSKSSSQDAFRYKYIKEQGDDLILFGKRTLLQAERLESLNNKIFLTVEDKEGSPGEFVLKALRHTDDPNGAELIMDVNGFTFRKKSGFDTDGETILEDYATTTELTITDGKINSEIERATTAEGTMSSRITQTADAITAEVTRATAAETEAYSRITQTADAITAEVARATNAETEAYSRITQTADAITAEVTRATTAEGSLGSRITQTADSINLEVSKKVGNNEIISRINQTAESILIQASKINLSGYVTASQFNALSGSFNNLVSGTTSASKLTASNGNFSNLEITNALTYGGYGDLKKKIINALSSSASGGTITISSTTLDGSAGPSVNFNIADTQFYKDAVRSAKNEGIRSVKIKANDIILDPTGTPTYYSASKKYSVPVYAEATNGESNTNGIMIDASEAWNAGRDAAEAQYSQANYAKDNLTRFNNGNSVKLYYFTGSPGEESSKYRSAGDKCWFYSSNGDWDTLYTKSSS